jgi:hypothetical protein
MIFATSMVVVMIIIAFLEPDMLYQTLSNRWFIPSAILGGVLAYRIYGSIEILVGVLGIVYAVIITRSDLLSKMIAISGGMYILLEVFDARFRRSAPNLLFLRQPGQAHSHDQQLEDLGRRCGGEQRDNGQSSIGGLH